VLELSDQAIATVTKPTEPEAESLDASWAEPEAFAGCSSAGQQRPGQPQPLHFVPPSRTSVSRGAAS
ncbi:MAG: nitrate reductase molybdenum cofactor assembly chaperone, partial [Burkholderiaceae bacterium]|nr:nitrate reductase molybdenum cofactor assembly chaperone [Burkholderiaceae bacterium]